MSPSGCRSIDRRRRRCYGAGTPTTVSALKRSWSSDAGRLSPRAGLQCTTGAAGAIDPATAREQAGEPGAIRFAVPEGGVTAFEDAVFGRVEFANSELEDFVLLRSDGVPTYHLSVVADDLDMGLTHVIRGADHISNTPKQVLQYQALGDRSRRFLLIFR